VRGLLLVAVLASLTDPRVWLEQYSAAVNEHRERPFFADGARLWVGEKSGPGRPVGVGTFTDWERASHTRWTYELIGSEPAPPGDAVTARVTETSDFLALLPPERTEGRVTYVRGGDGLVTEILYRPVGPRPPAMVRAFAAWSQIHMPEERRELLPKGEIAWRAELLPRWLEALRRWRREGGPETEARAVGLLAAHFAAVESGAGGREAKKRALAPGARIWFEDKAGEGEPIDLDSNGSAWDEELHARLTYTNPRGGGDTAAADCVETNDFYELAGIHGWKATITWRFDSEGRVLEEVYVPVEGQPSWRAMLAPFFEWLKKTYPDELAVLLPNDRLRRSRDSAIRWRNILQEWRSKP
jgi:hypothetical protein